MKTAEEILSKSLGMGCDYLNDVTLKECANIKDVIEAMKLYANQKLDEAAEKARVLPVGPSHQVDKQSILSLKDKPITPELLPIY